MASTDEILAKAWQVHQNGGTTQAEATYRSVLQSEPGNANAWCYWGIALHDLKRFADAVKAYENAIRLQPRFPIAYNNMGNTLRYLGRVADADQSFEIALQQDPKYFNALRNRGTLHAWTGRIDLAFEYYHQAMKLNPNDAELHRNLGVIHLLQGNYRDGWAEYDYRWRCAEAIAQPYRQPKWTGQPLDGKTILLYAEQGLGDTIQFVRFARELKNRGATTLVHTQPALVALLQRCPGIDRLIPNSIPVEYPFDFHCSLVDAAAVLVQDNASIPNSVPYLTIAEGLKSYWKNGLEKGLPPAKLRIGINWQGNPDHQADVFRSFPLKSLLPLCDVEGVQLISLQKGFGSEQLKQWSGSQVVYCLPGEVDQTSGAFLDTAAILHRLDCVVTSDTAIAHLAGALGIPAGLLLGFTPDWRWQLGSDETPWYPKTKLFRQPKVGDWETPVHQLCQWLRANHQHTSAESS
jgi:Flp pilus assembly protein TadD